MSTNSTMVTGSNATDTKLASALEGLGGDEKGTLAFLTIQKKGVIRGVGDNKVIYDNDVVQTLLWMGHSYRSLAIISYKKLHQIWSKGNLTATLIEAVTKKGYAEPTIQEVSEVIQEVEDGFLKVMNATESVFEDGDSPFEGDEATLHHWEPMKVNGVPVRGTKVYVGPGDATNPRAPVPGTIYIDGVKLGEKVLQPATNGHWKANKKPKTVAKDILRSWLPIGLYSRYALDRERLIEIKIGAEASPAAKDAQIPIDPEALRQLFKLVP
ncbi:MAG: hypothetical protein WCO84_06580 [bacterium]